MICAIAGFPMAHQRRNRSAPSLRGAYSPLAWRKCCAIGKGPTAHRWRNGAARTPTAIRSRWMLSVSFWVLVARTNHRGIGRA